jgi:hypothetical protein
MIKREAKDAERFAVPPIPTYEAPYDVSQDPRIRRLFLSFDEINFWIRVWKDFRRRQGRWPMLTMTIHYLQHILFVIAALFFFIYTDKFDWSTLQKWIMGITLAVAYVVLVRWARSLAWEYDWKAATRRSERR